MSMCARIWQPCQLSFGIKLFSGLAIPCSYSAKFCWGKTAVNLSKRDMNVKYLEYSITILEVYHYRWYLWPSMYN